MNSLTAEITINTTPSSTVTIIAVNQISVLESIISKFRSLERALKHQPRTTESNLFVLTNHYQTCSNLSITESLSEDDNFVKVASDTWIFDTVEVGDSGSLTVTKPEPISPDTWFVAAVSLNAKFGMAISEVQQFAVAKSLFVQINFPELARYEEITKVDVRVFNFMDEPQIVEVTLFKNDENDEEFTFIQKDSDCNPHTFEESEKSEELQVEAKSVNSVTFFIRPSKIGVLKLQAKAETSEISIEMEENLIVQAEVITNYESTSVLIDLRRSQTFSTASSTSLPSNAVRKSIKIDASIVTDLLNPALFDVTTLM